MDQILNIRISKIDKKIPDISGLVKKADFNTKVVEIEGKYLVLLA